MTNLLSGEFTVKDFRLYDFLRTLYKSEKEQIEPSSCAAFIGPVNLCRKEEAKLYCEQNGLTDERLKNATQIVWATGGCLVPEEIQKEYLNTFMTEDL